MSEVTKDEKNIEKTKDLTETTNTGSQKADEAEKHTLDDLEIYTPYIDASVAKHKKARKIRKIVLASVLSVIVLLYLGGVIYHSVFFSRQTTLNSFDVSGKNIDYVTNIIDQDMDSYELTVSCLSEEHEITSSDNVYSVTSEKSVKKILQDQNPWLWLINIWKPHSIDVGYVAAVDENALDELLSTYDCMQTENMEKPKNAYVSMKGGEVHVVQESKGSMLDVEKTEETIETAITDMDKTIDLYDSGCYERADICADSDELNAELDNAEKYLSIEAVYDFNGYEVPISKEELATMADFDKSGNVVVNKDKVYEFAEDFADKYSTCYTDRRFKNHHGDTILVYGGYYGWQLDAETEAPLLYESLVSGESFTREFSCEKEGYAYCDMNDIGENYVEIDLTHQHVYVYENGKQVFDTACVSGNESRGMSTPGGLYGLTYKQLNATLNGPGYSTPVSYWMPFNGGIGLHDATWKTVFGEDYYKTDGSHGCINLPLEAAATIYEYIETGSPVVCYWENEVEYID